MATKSKAFGSKSARAPHLVKPGGGLKGEVWDFRNDVEESFSSIEGRTASDEWPELQWLDGGAPAAAGGDLVLKGVYLLQGQTFASLTLWATTSAVAITALKPGEGGNDFTIQVTGGGTAGSESVTKTGNAFVIDIQPTVSTANQIATAINATGADSDGYLMAVSGGADAVNAIAAAANMTGGVGEGWACYVSGVECLPANTTGATGVAAVAEGECTVTVPDLTAETDARAAGDIAEVAIFTDGVATQALAVALA